MMQKKLLTFLIYIFVFSPFLSFSAERESLSWKDIGTKKITEDQLVKFAGRPNAVLLLPEDYFQIKNGKNPEKPIFQYYTIGNHNPILFNKTPLSIDDQVKRIEAIFCFQSGFVISYNYTFTPPLHPKISREKYVNIFNTILGEPIRYAEHEQVFGSTTFIYHYKNHVTVSFDPDSPNPFVIRLNFHPDN
jgi:hypothetical protein